MFYLSLLCIYFSFFLPMALNEIGIQKAFTKWMRKSCKQQLIHRSESQSHSCIYGEYRNNFVIYFLICQELQSSSSSYSIGLILMFFSNIPLLSLLKCKEESKTKPVIQKFQKPHLMRKGCKRHHVLQIPSEEFI